MKSKRIYTLGLVAALVAVAAAANATVIWNYSTIYTGGTPTGGTPWARLTISNGAGSGDVDFLMENLMPLNSGEFLGELQFNTVTTPSGVTASNLVNASFSHNGVTGPGGTFDLDVKFPTGNNHLIPPGTSSWTLHGTGLNEDSFNDVSSKGVESLLHLQGLPEECGGSTWAMKGSSAVPEPASMAALLIGGVGLLKRRKK